jgi:hypothetical protein
MNPWGQMTVHDYIERRWCPYCLVLVEAKGARGKIVLVQRMNGGRGKPSHVSFPTHRGFVEHIKREHGASFTRMVVAA